MFPLLILVELEITQYSGLKQVNQERAKCPLQTVLVWGCLRRFSLMYTERPMLFGLQNIFLLNCLLLTMKRIN